MRMSLPISLPVCLHAYVCFCVYVYVESLPSRGTTRGPTEYVRSINLLTLAESLSVVGLLSAGVVCSLESWSIIIYLSFLYMI